MAPRGVVVNAVTETQHCLVAAEHLPGGAEAGFESCPIHIDACRPTHSILIGNQKLTCCGNVVGLASAVVRDGRGHIPRQADIEGDGWCDPPIIFGERTIAFPAATGDRALIRLVMNGEAR